MAFGGYEHIKHPTPKEREAYHNYTCGHCGNKASGIVVATYRYGGLDDIKWLLCPSCGDGSVYSSSRTIFPGISYGPIIEGLPELINKAYQEARDCFSVGAFTACELVCRGILMHVAIEKGAKEDQSFSAYLSFLEGKGYVTPPMKAWVDLIRQHGNKAAHLLEPPDKKRSESTLMLTVELLRLIYEMEHMANQYASKPKPGKTP